MTLDFSGDLHPPVSDSSSSCFEEATEWFARLRSENCSDEERRLFESWRSRAPEHAAAYEQVMALWSDPALRSAATQAAALSRPFESTNPVARRVPFQVKPFALAATIAGVLILIGLGMDLPLRLASDYHTSTGERQVVQLSDGSVVTMNTRSAIGMAYDDRNRRVDLLAGEAFFQVAPDAQKAFVVSSYGITTRAVGTEFLVRHQADGIQVTVTEGVVELAPAHSGWAPIHVAAGKQIVVSTRGPEPARDVDVNRVTSWLRGRLVVEDARLGDVIEELRRYHSGTIQVWNRSVNEIRVSGSYNLADPMAVLLALTETLPVQMARVTDRVVVLF
ncbi:MAG: FecR domain-containing protein [Nitrospira sp.]